jgi:hypothetical protein
LSEEDSFMNFIRSMFFVVVLCVSSGSVATAQDFDKGVAAYQAGDFATALQEFLPLAEGRNSPSRLSLADRIFDVSIVVVQTYGLSKLIYIKDKARDSATLKAQQCS